MRVVIDGTDAEFGWAIRSLNSRGFDVMMATERAATNAEILWTGITTRIDGLVKDVYPSLRYVCCPATGIDHIDVTGLNACGVKVLSLRDCMDDIRDVSATAELTLYLMLAMLRPHANGREIGNDLKGKRVLVVGCGRIGLQVCRLCEAFGCEVVAIDKADAIGLYGALKTADIVTLHVPLNAETEGMFGKAAFAVMKPGAILINTSRGKVIHEGQLIDALRRGQTVTRAALDVHANEPGAPHPALLELAKAAPHVLKLTNHIGGFTVESRATTDKALVECLMRQIEADRGT